MTFASSFPNPHIPTISASNTSTFTLLHIPTTSSSLQNLHFLFIPTSSSSSFPLSIKTPKPHFHTLSDSIHDNFFVQDLENFNGVHQLEAPNQPPKMLIRDPPWIFNGLCKETTQKFRILFNHIEMNKYDLLRRRQIKAETEAWERMVEEYRELEREMCEKNLAPNLPHIKALFLGWFEPLRDAIEAEQKSQRSKKHRAAFAPHIDLLPASKLAVIVMHKMMGLMTLEHHHAGCVLLVHAAVQIGMAVEQEVLDALASSGPYIYGFAKCSLTC